MKKQGKKKKGFISDEKESEALGRAIRLFSKEIENEATVSEMPITYLKNGFLVAEDKSGKIRKVRETSAFSVSSGMKKGMVLHARE